MVAVDLMLRFDKKNYSWLIVMLVTKQCENYPKHPNLLGFHSLNLLITGTFMRPLIF